MGLALFYTTILLVFQFAVGFKSIGMRRIQPSFFLLKDKYKSTRLVRNIVTRKQLSTVADIPVDKIHDVNTFVKRKVALTIGFQGSKYYGLQFDIREEFPTIEAELEKALFKLGCIRESNHKDLNKISWSRSSRTDKHVHSARLVISTKLEISLKWMKGEEQRMPALVEKLNLILPTDIRVLSACKVNQGFRAREACSWREYEYLLPRALLLSTFNDSDPSKNEQNEHKILSLFSKCLQRFEGSNSFHNFHRLSPKNLKGRLFTNGESEDNPTDAEDFSDLPRETAATAQDRIAQINATFVAADNPGYVFNLNENWIPKIREQTEMTRTTIFACERISEDVGNSSFKDFIRIRVRGQSFLLHQIRLMIGAAVLVSRGVLPESALELALTGPYFINFPLAPAEGLILVNAGFERNSNGQNIVIYPLPGKSIDENDSISLMTQEELNYSEKFKEEEIYSKVKDDWYRDGGELSSKFLEHSERFRAPENLAPKWNEMAANFTQIAEIALSERRSKEASRLEKNVADFQFAYMKDTSQQQAQEEEAKKYDRGQKKPLRIQLTPHKKLLPNTIATAIVTKFRVLPGEDVSQVLRAVATLFAKNQLPYDMTNEDIVQYIVDNGGFEHFLKNVEKHPMIE
mmetsp:Transcript_20481/g.19807  ORF Transcript_20481/g.19807 Transcript_20481/m.19807 type:complete len:633 (-) Transcript_20481:154-2052(-)